MRRTTSPKTSRPTSSHCCDVWPQQGEPMMDTKTASRLRLVWLLSAIACSLPAMAQWSGKGEAGIALASGNTDTKSANARVAVGYKSDAWEDSASLAGNYVR